MFVIDDPTYIFQNREAKDGFVLSGFVAVGNHELYHSVLRYSCMTDYLFAKYFHNSLWLVF